jgi:alpha-beta hydrolase superfamily lysophospholipase
MCLPHTKINGMAEEFLHDIRAVHPGGPYLLAGYSAGGLAAYEMAQLLASMAEPVALALRYRQPTARGWSPTERLRYIFRSSAPVDHAMSSTAQPTI